MTVHDGKFSHQGKVPDQSMQRVCIGHPANKAGVGRERNDSVSSYAQVSLGCGPVVGQHAVYQAKELHHALILPQILMTLQGMT